MFISHKNGTEHKRSSDIEVFLDSRFVFAAAKRINNKEERIKNKHGVRFADGF